MKNILTIFLLLTCGLCGGQNLVPNGDFEQYVACPRGNSQMDSAVAWFQPTKGTCDYFNQCNTHPHTVSVPNNSFGFQDAHSGVAYSGIYLFTQSISEWREYIEVPLVTTLVANTCYHLEMYVSLADYSRFVTYELGAYFSDTIVDSINTYFPLPFTPQINNTTSVFDTINWTKVCGTYIANGTENYLIIGNFKDDVNTPRSYFYQGSITIDGAYVYIDDVSVTPCGSPCTTTGIEENEREQIKISPNPFSNQLTFSLADNEQTTISLYNFLGQQVLRQTFTNSTTINTEQLADGIYFYELRSNKGSLKTGKLVKQ